MGLRLGQAIKTPVGWKPSARKPSKTRAAVRRPAPAKTMCLKKRLELAKTTGRATGRITPARRATTKGPLTGLTPRTRRQVRTPAWVGVRTRLAFRELARLGPWLGPIQAVRIRLRLWPRVRLWLRLWLRSRMRPRVRAWLRLARVAWVQHKTPTATKERQVVPIEALA